MIRHLRTCHRRAWTVLFAVLPVLFAVVILARQPRPLVARLPEGLTGSPSLSEAPRHEWTGLWGELPITTSLYASSPRLGLEPLAPLGVPDLLVYWSPTMTTDGPLPEDAILLGSLRGAGVRRYGLPPGAAANGGQLLLYSLAHGEVVARAAWSPPSAGTEPSP